MSVESTETKKFELVMCVRDSHGKKTDKKKSFSSDSPYKVWEIFEKTDVKPRKTKGVKTDSTKPEDILKAVGEYAEKKQEIRDKDTNKESNVKE